MDRGRIIHIAVFMIFVGIPTSATFYPPLVSRFTNLLQLNPISIWLGRLGVLLVVVYLGNRLLNVLGTRSTSGTHEDASEDMTLQDLDKIEGCIERQGVAWKGTAHLNRNNITNIEVPFDPICPNCQTGFIDTTDDPSFQEQRQNPGYSPKAQSIPVFSCPNNNCGHTVERNAEQHDAARRLFERYARQIVESTDEDYSLRALVENIHGPVTPQAVWKRYTEVVDDDQVSTNCFH